MARMEQTLPPRVGELAERRLVPLLLAGSIKPLTAEAVGSALPAKGAVAVAAAVPNLALVMLVPRLIAVAEEAVVVVAADRDTLPAGDMVAVPPLGFTSTERRVQ